jgi:hypothetical protein
LDRKALTATPVWIALGPLPFFVPFVSPALAAFLALGKFAAAILHAVAADGVLVFDGNHLVFVEIKAV